MPPIHRTYDKGLPSGSRKPSAQQRSAALPDECPLIAAGGPLALHLGSAWISMPAGMIKPAIVPDIIRE